MSAKDRKASSYAHAGNGLVEGRLYNAFVAGWDACANQQDLIELEYDEALKERDALRSENERLKADWKADATKYEKEIKLWTDKLISEQEESDLLKSRVDWLEKENEIKFNLLMDRSRWREQAEKLAETLKMYSTLKIGAMHWEHHDRFSHSETPAIEALAEFEAFKGRE